MNLKKIQTKASLLEPVTGYGNRKASQQNFLQIVTLPKKREFMEAVV